MAIKTIQVADKPTLDEVKAEIQNEDYGLEAIKTAIGSSGGGGRQYEGVISTTTIDISVPFYHSILYAAVVLFDNAIHLFDGELKTEVKHYKYDFSSKSWSELNNAPNNIKGKKCAVVYKGTIHILCDDALYKWDKNTDTWENVSAYPYTDNSNPSTIVRGENLYIIGIKTSSSGSATYIGYYTEGTGWSSPIATSTYGYGDNPVVLLNDEIHILDVYDSSQSFQRKHIIIDKSNNTTIGVDTLYSDYNFEAVIATKDNIHYWTESGRHEILVDGAWVAGTTSTETYTMSTVALYDEDAGIVYFLDRSKNPVPYNVKTDAYSKENEVNTITYYADKDTKIICDKSVVCNGDVEKTEDGYSCLSSGFIHLYSNSFLASNLAHIIM